MGSEAEGPNDAERSGPHPVSRADLTAWFTLAGWRIASIESERLLARFAPEGFPACLAKIERV